MIRLRDATRSEGAISPSAGDGQAAAGPRLRPLIGDASVFGALRLEFEVATSPHSTALSHGGESASGRRACPGPLVSREGFIRSVTTFGSCEMGSIPGGCRLAREAASQAPDQPKVRLLRAHGHERGERDRTGEAQCGLRRSDREEEVLGKVPAASPLIARRRAAMPRLRAHATWLTVPCCLGIGESRA